MAYLPLPSPSNSPKRATVPLQRLSQSEPIQPSKISALFTELRQILNGGGQPVDSILHAITDAALVMTGASGIALALRNNDAVVCRACAGEIAPQLGRRLNVDSGISGECFRTGEALRCDDTQTDDRVDPEVCRILGIRSIAVVPVRGREGTVGILEALATRPHAFSGEHLSLLQRLAEIGEVANDREFGVDLESKAIKLPEIPSNSVRQDAGVSLPDEALMANLFGERFFRGRRGYWIGAGITLALLLMSAVIWMSLSDTDGEAVASEHATQSQTAPHETPSHPNPPLMPSKPIAGRVRVRGDGLVLKGALHNATTLEPEPPAASEVPSPTSKAAGVNASQPPPTSDISVQLPPEVAANAPETAALVARIASTPTILPTADLVISQGITDATLERSVLPVYPSMARAKHMDGAVVLEVTIAEDGSTRDLKMISGPPLLADAATEAVRQWRYHPSLLSGKPVAVQKRITIVFKNP